MSSELDHKDLDYIFENIVGAGGFWQWYVLLLILPIGIASGKGWNMLKLFVCTYVENDLK